VPALLRRETVQAASGLVLEREPQVRVGYLAGFEAMDFGLRRDDGLAEWFSLWCKALCVLSVWPKCRHGVLLHLADGQYGDRFPVTAAGRGVASVLMVIGVAVFGVVTATIATYFVETDSPSSPQVAAR
jgi:hypothetical protein